MMLFVKNIIFYRATQTISDQSAKRNTRIFNSLVLGGMLFLGAGATLPSTAVAATDTLGETILAANVDLPVSVASPVLQDISQKSGTPTSQLRIVGAEQKTWSDGCLGLADPGQLCTQALVPGWRVTVESNRLQWVYRTDSNGMKVKLEGTLPKEAASHPPAEVANAVLQDASQRSGLPVSGLTIVQAQKQTWSDGCLGLADPGQLCTQALVPGWRVTVEGGQTSWVYRTNDSGSLIKLDTAASQINGSNSSKPIKEAPPVKPPIEIQPVEPPTSF